MIVQQKMSFIKKTFAKFEISPSEIEDGKVKKKPGASEFSVRKRAAGNSPTGMVVKIMFGETFRNDPKSIEMGPSSSL